MLAACAFTFPLGCVSTDVANEYDAAPCVGRVEARVANEAVLVVDSLIAEGLVRCSGVAIAPTLVVTNVGCVYRPSGISDPKEAQSDGLREATTFYPALGYADACAAERDWAPIEDGTLSASFGKRIERTQIAVYSVASLYETYTVRNVFTSGAGSRCEPGIALLELDRELAVVTLPVRLDESSVVGEPVTLAGNCLVDYTLGRHELASTIDGITFESSNSTLPSRSVLLRQGVLATDYGGAVISPETGALIAIVASGADARCDGQDPEGTTVAVRLAPFWGMLLDVAASRDIPLRSETASDGESESSSCD